MSTDAPERRLIEVPSGSRPSIEDEQNAALRFWAVETLANLQALTGHFTRVTRRAAELGLPSSTPKRRILNALRTTIGLALVVIAVIGCAVVQIEADDREGGR